MPQTRLERRVWKYRADPGGAEIMGNFKPVFTPAQEDELVSYLKNMEGHLFDLTSKELRLLEFQLAERNNLQHLFNKIKKIAGED